MSLPFGESQSPDVMRRYNVAFLVQALLLARAAWRGSLAFALRADASGIAGGALVVLALVVQPLLAMAAGRHYPVTPTFGLPRPTTILTLGLLAWTGPRTAPALWIVPLLWTVVRGSATAPFPAPL